MLQMPVVTLCATRINIQTFYVLTTECSNVTCNLFRTNNVVISLYNINDLFVGYNREGISLLRGTS